MFPIQIFVILILKYLRKNPPNFPSLFIFSLVPPLFAPERLKGRKMNSYYHGIFKLTLTYLKTRITLSTFFLII